MPNSKLSISLEREKKFAKKSLPKKSAKKNLPKKVAKKSLPKKLVEMPGIEPGS